MNDQEWKDAQAKLEGGVEHRQRVATARETPVGRYIDLYREHCGTTPTLNNQECEVINRLVESYERDAELRAADALRWRERFEALEGASKAPRSGCKVCGGTSASQCALRAGWQCEHAPSAIGASKAEQAIREHNEGCDQACAARRPVQGGDGCGYQTTDGSPIYGRRRCPECPLDWKIEYAPSSVTQRDDDTLPGAQPYPAHFGDAPGEAMSAADAKLLADRLREAAEASAQYIGRPKWKSSEHAMSNDPLRRVIAEYVETWDGGHGHPGFCVCQVIEEFGKPTRVERGKPMYLRNMPEMRDWWDVYQRAASNLRSRAWYETQGKRRKKDARAGDNRE